MRLFGEPLRNLYEPRTSGFRIYDFGNNTYAAFRTIEKTTITRVFSTLEECYAFLKKHHALLPDDVDSDQDSPLASWQNVLTVSSK